MAEHVGTSRFESVPSAASDAVSHAWVVGLTTAGPDQEATFDRLHGMLVRIARGEANRRSGLNGIAGQELEDLAHHAAADALMSIVRRIGDFQGDSRFTTWAYKFVVLEVSSKFARHEWRRERVRLDEDAWGQLPGRLGADPEDVVGSLEMVAALRAAVEQELTPHQRRVFVAIVLEATPLDALVVELGSNRNAIYKTLFDARRKLRHHLVAKGLIETWERRPT